MSTIRVFPVGTGARRSAIRALDAPATVALLLLAIPRSSGAQMRVEAPERVAWPLIDFIVVGHSTYGVQLLASPNLQSEQGREQTQAVMVTLEPGPTRRWAAGVAMLVDSVAKLPGGERKPFVTAALSGNLGRAQLRLSLNPKAAHSRPFDLEIVDSSEHLHSPRIVGWSVPASPTDLLVLLTTLDDVAERSSFDSAAQSRDSTVAFLECQLDQHPRAKGTPRLSYPGAALIRGREGRVWAEFVIDTSGAVRQETVRVLMSDGEEFSRTVLEALPKMRYTAGMRHGTPVKTRVWAPFVFRFRSP